MRKTESKAEDKQNSHQPIPRPRPQQKKENNKTSVQQPESVEVGQQLPLKIRQTILLPVVQSVVALSLTFRLIWLLLSLKLESIFLGFAINSVFKLVGSLLLLLVALIAIGYFILWWKNNYYLVDTRKATHRRGVFWTRRNTFRFPSLDVIQLRQSLLGNIFNFGTILLRFSETEEQILIKKIPKPRYYLDLFKQLLPRAEIY